jgi:hypothetical protein
MGFICELKRSLNKTKLLTDASNESIYENSKKELLYDFIIRDEKLSSVLRLENAGKNELRKIVRTLQDWGLGFINNDYIPISAICFCQPLLFALTSLCSEEEELDKNFIIETLVSYFQN